MGVLDKFLDIMKLSDEDDDYDNDDFFDDEYDDDYDDRPARFSAALHLSLNSSTPYMYLIFCILSPICLSTFDSNIIHFLHKA